MKPRLGVKIIQCKMCPTKISVLENNITRKYCSVKCKCLDVELSKKKSKNNEGTIAVCTICKQEFADYNNISGSLTRHCKLSHNMNMDKLLFVIKDKDPEKKFICPICNQWSTTDVSNKSGNITLHLKIHNHNPGSFCKLYPEYKSLWKMYFLKETRINFLESKDNFITCLVCRSKQKKLTNSHLRIHGITPTQYKSKYDLNTTVSKTTSDLQSKITTQLNP